MTPSRRRSALAAIGGVAFALRVVFLWRRVFAGGIVRFQDVDSWYHARFAENLTRHFPWPMAVDPYLAFGSGGGIPIAPGFDYVVALFSLLLGGGHPSTLTIDVVAALLPPLLGALIVLPAYSIAAAFLDEAWALFAAALAAVLPGQFLQRSTLGYADHHVLEAVTLAGAIALLLAAVRGPAPRRAAIGAGACLFAYCLTWGSAMAGIALLALACAAAMLGGARRALVGLGADNCAIAVAAATMFGTAALLLAPFMTLVPSTRLQVTALAVVTVAASALAFAARIGAGDRPTARRSVALLAMSLGPGVVALIIVVAEWSAIAHFAAATLSRLPRPGRPVLVVEAAPLWSGNPLVSLWSESGAAWIVACAGFALLSLRAFRARDAAAAMVLVWSAATLAAMTIELRFGYYAALPIAILATIAISHWRRAALSKPLRRAAEALALFVFVNAAGLAVLAAGRDRGPSPEWIEAMRWLRRSTPEPFDSALAFERQWPAAPLPSYSVMAWWDFGYWISTIGHRVPVSNPTQAGARRAAAFFTALDEASADGVAGTLRSRYVVVDPMLQVAPLDPVSPESFAALAVWAKQPLDRFLETYEDRRGAQPRNVVLFYPEYFQAMTTRLALFGGAAAEPASVWVVTWTAAAQGSGAPSKQIAGLRRYATYAEAGAAVASAPEHRRIVSLDPRASCVPVAALAHYARVHASAAVAASTGGPAVQIFERRR